MGPEPRLRVGLDFRPALLGAAGIARATRELARALARRTDLELRLFGHALARARVAPPAELVPALRRWPLPGRWQPVCARTGIDAGALCGGVDLFHWTDTIHPPVRRRPTVLTLHDVAFAADPAFHGAAGAGLAARARAAAMQAARIAVPTAATRDQAIELLQLPAAKFRVIPFGADHLPRDHAGGPGREAHALCIGTIEPRKNHIRLITAWRLLPAPRPPLVVVGRRGWECVEAVAALQQAEAEGLLRWLPDAGDAQLTGLLRDARLLVYPSQLEGFGFPPLEAMAAGIPVVAGETPALAEVLGDTAVLCDPQDASAIAAGVARVWNDARLRAQLRERGHARVARYRWDACAAAYAELYREVVA